MDNINKNILQIINEYVELQESLVTTFKNLHSFEDWVLLTDVPKNGMFEFKKQKWLYKKHGTGISFSYQNYYVDMNRHLDDKPSTFDVFRIVDYLEHRGKKQLKYDDEVLLLNYETLNNIFKQIEKKGLIKRRKELSGEIYETTK